MTASSPPTRREYHRPVLVDAVLRLLVGTPGPSGAPGPSGPSGTSGAPGASRVPGAPSGATGATGPTFAATAPGAWSRARGRPLYLDGTVGGGGHAAELLARCPRCRLVALDRDPAALDAARRRLADHAARVRFERMSFGDAAQDAELRRDGVAGALLDLGLSSHQLDRDRRGFTFRRGAPLDMRMNPAHGPTAAAFLARAGRRELLEALREGQAPRPGAVTARILRRRRARPLRTSDDLVAALESVLARRSTHAEKARLFQAVRIRVNDELGVLRRALPEIRDLLVPGATLVAIAYHGGEDRVLKRAFRQWSDPSHGLPDRLPVRDRDLPRLGSTLTRKPVLADTAEVAANPRARSARLRAWRRAA